MILRTTIIAAALVLGAAAAPAQTSVLYDLNNIVKVVDATATPAHAGGKTIIRFRVVNDGPARIHLHGIATPVAAAPRLMARVDANRAVDIGSIVIAPDEVLDGTGAQLWFEAEPVERELAAGQSFPATFEFGDARVTVPVMVDASPAG
ncbi:MAG: hypothetical protein AB7K86_25460 [Rhodospirillales bacterium]